MTPRTFIFIGRSGCGKGTQAQLLDQYIKRHDETTPIYHLETGKRFREFLATEGLTQDLARTIMLAGRRQPDFLAIWMWSHHFIEDLTGNEHIIIDGTPRSLVEAEALDNALTFYGRNQPVVIYIDVSREWSKKHLMARGRADDTRDDIESRLNWFEKDVLPAVEYFRMNPNYIFRQIHGEQTIENVHKEIIEKLGF